MDKLITADSTAGLFMRAAPAFEQHWDYDLAGDAAPATIVQLEGVYRIVPDDPRMMMQVIRAYVGYAYGWIELDAEALDFKGDFNGADKKRRRARNMYLRAKDVAMHLLNKQADGIQARTRQSAEDFEKWIAKKFDDKDDAEALLWAGYAWGSYINAAKDDMGAVAELPYAKALVARSIELDPDYYYAAGDTFMGVVAASELPPDYDESKKHFELAFERTERRALLTQVNMARYWAVPNEDREMFDSLLNEVMEAGDVLPDARLANRIARKRAQLYIDNADELF